jgi:hypothetical protein
VPLPQAQMPGALPDGLHSVSAGAPHPYLPSRCRSQMLVRASMRMSMLRCDGHAVWQIRSGMHTKNGANSCFTTHFANVEFFYRLFNSSTYADGGAGSESGSGTSAS